MSGEKQEQMRFSSNPGNGNNTESTQVLRDSVPVLGFVKNFNVRTRPAWLEIVLLSHFSMAVFCCTGERARDRIMN